VIGVGSWAARANGHWVVTTEATFGAINFYTQWFEGLGDEPWAIIIAGLTIVGIAAGLCRTTASAPAMPRRSARGHSQCQRWAPRGLRQERKTPQDHLALDQGNEA
jgi:hypothetical protein